MNTILQFLNAETKKPSDCGKHLEIVESSRDLGWNGVILEVGSSPEFHPNNVTTPYFYFGLDTGIGIHWKAKKNSVFTDIHSIAGQIWMNPPWVGFTHSISEECHFIILAISEETMFSHFTANYNNSAINWKDILFLNGYNIVDPYIKTMIDLFHLEVKGNSKNSNGILDSLLNSFANYFILNYSNYRDWIENSSQKNLKVKPEEVNQIQKYILENISENISIDELSMELNLSKFHFLREFKRTSGLTPYQFILKTKMEVAKKQILSGKKSITEIALDLGYVDQSHFSNSFSRFFGNSPKSFQKSNFLQN